MTGCLLIIMARYPTLGKVKTRLAREIGKPAALRVYRQLLDHHLHEFQCAPFDVEWRYTPARAPFHRVVVAAVPSGGEKGRKPPGTAATTPAVKPQPTGNLGGRMQRIFEESFAAGYSRVVMIGTDAPRMNRPTVRRAFDLLESNPAVFQPTADGGYALVGLSTMLDVFTGITWSTDRVMTETRERLRDFGIAFAELPPTFDVDTAADLGRLTATRAPGKIAARARRRRHR